MERRDEMMRQIVASLHSILRHYGITPRAGTVPRAVLGLIAALRAEGAIETPRSEAWPADGIGCTLAVIDGWTVLSSSGSSEAYRAATADLLQRVAAHGISPIEAHVWLSALMLVREAARRRPASELVEEAAALGVEMGEITQLNCLGQVEWLAGFVVDNARRQAA